MTSSLSPCFRFGTVTSDAHAPHATSSQICKINFSLLKRDVSLYLKLWVLFRGCACNPRRLSDSSLKDFEKKIVSPTFRRYLDKITYLHLKAAKPPLVNCTLTRRLGGRFNQKLYWFSVWLYSQINGILEKYLYNYIQNIQVKITMWKPILQL